MYVLQLTMDVNSNIYIWTWMNVDKCEWMSTNEIHPQLLNTIHLFQYYIPLRVII